MAQKTKTILFISIMLFTFIISSCDETKEKQPPVLPQVVSIKIPQKETPRKVTPVKKTQQPAQQPVKKAVAQPVEADEPKMAAHYNATGKIDPFKPLIQATPEKPKDAGIVKPERILTPLEKIELSQIRLVAVIITKTKRIAMVEEASGKGYEVGVGTFIGRRQGTITQIKDSSIVVKEPVRDYMGKLSERVQEIKIHKKDVED